MIVFNLEKEEQEDMIGVECIILMTKIMLCLDGVGEGFLTS